LRGFTTNNANPTGLQRRIELWMLRRFAAAGFAVYAVNRRPGMPLGTSMAQIADEHAKALRAEFGEPVNLVGMSTGGSIAQQLAADHPDVVRRLVIAGSAHRLDPVAARAHREYVERTARGQRGLHLVAGAAARNRIARTALAALMWLADPLSRPKDPTDMLVMARAEDAFDLADRLGEITAPTLVIGGARDFYYTPELFRRTAEAIPNGQLVLYPKADHKRTFSNGRFFRDVIGFCRS
jgi:pimeloyl-ACP methyl ester carboxylesterase